MVFRNYLFDDPRWRTSTVPKLGPNCQRLLPNNQRKGGRKSTKTFTNCHAKRNKRRRIPFGVNTPEGLSCTLSSCDAGTGDFNGEALEGPEFGWGTSVWSSACWKGVNDVERPGYSLKCFQWILWLKPSNYTCYTAYSIQCIDYDQQQVYKHTLFGELRKQKTRSLLYLWDDFLKLEILRKDNKF